MPVVSMKSGLEDRNNTLNPHPDEQLHVLVSMKSGLEDRNNRATGQRMTPRQ